MSNMIISMVIMVVVQNAVNSFFGFETPAQCKEGVNDMPWSGKYYRSTSYFHPQSVIRTSHYIELPDGVQLAADLYLSEQATVNDILQPTVLHFTRHGRGYTLDFPLSAITAGGKFINPRTAAYITRITTTSFAWLVVDIRGTGASYGKKEFDFVDQEAEDAKAIIDWVTKQPWSNGEVTAFGFGVDGVSAIIAASTGHPVRPETKTRGTNLFSLQAMKALAISGVPADLFDTAFLPGGLYNHRMSSMYSSFTAATDANKRWDQVPHFKARLMMTYFGGNVFPVNESQPAVMAAAVSEHSENPLFSAQIKDVFFRDDKLASVDRTFADIDVPRLFEKLARSNVAVLNMAGYYDMGVSRSAILLHKYLTRQLDADSIKAYGLTALPPADIPATKYHLVLGPWSHSNVDNVDPFAEAKTRCFEHIEEISRFFDYHIYPEERTELTKWEEEEPIHYFTLAESKWKTTTEWPPAIVDETFTFYLSDNKTLVQDVADVVDGEQSITVDPKHDTLPGIIGRWNALDHIFLNKPTYAHNRYDTASKSISFSTPQLHQLEFAGEVTLKVYFSVDAPGVSLIAYLEDDNNIPPIEQQTLQSTKTKIRGGTTYITEGVVNPIHQSIAPGNPLRTFLKADSRVIEPDTVYEATFNFYPTSYFLPHHHQFRLTIVATEAGQFDLRSAEEATKLTIHFSEQYPSALTIRGREVPLPVKVAREPVKSDKTEARVEKEEDEFAEKIEL
ncbi:unnamed protein product [Aphanomyces euteiches]